MRIETSSGRRLAAAFAIAAAAALAAASGPARAQEGKAAPTSATCRICHTDPGFAAFSHKGLEESADGCLTCHADPLAHVKARGGRGNVPVPTKLAADAERELCLQCHDDKDDAKHFAPKGKDARCTDCHVLHGAPMPVRGAAKIPVPADLPAPSPAPAPMKLTGRVEAGWRFVGEEEGRYAQDVNLDDGPRLFGLDVTAASGDPAAARADLTVEGLGDPHAWGRLRVRKGDLWKVTADARHDELPFLGQNGLHGGETRRERFSADVDMRLSSLARLGLGYDRADIEGDIRGTTLVNGVVLPAAIRQDRLSQEGAATLDLRGREWHARLRQGWLSEDGSDGTHRDASAPGPSDVVAYDDDSTMEGPMTWVAVGADTLDGRVSVEARASRADLSREVDTTETGSGDLGGPYTTRSTTTGSRDRLVETQSLDASLTFVDSWALEASFDRSALREDGTVAGRSVTTTPAGTRTTTTSSEARVSQRTTEERVGVRRSLGRKFHLRGGAEWIQDSLDYYDAAAGGDVRTTGFFAGAEGAVTGNLRVHAEARTAHGTDVFTPLTPTDRDVLKAGASYDDAEEGVRGGIEWGLSDLESADGTAGSRGWDLRVRGGLGREDEATLDLGWTVRKLSLSVDTLSYIGSTLVPGESVSEVRSHVLDFAVALPLASALKFTLGGTFVVDQGTLPVRAFDATAGIRWRISTSLAARFEYRHREYDELGSDALDYEADILEVSVELSF